MKTCREMMIPMPQGALPTDSIDTVLNIMNSDNIGAVLIVTDHQSRHLIGIVTDRDIATKINAEKSSTAKSIQEIMSGDLIACQEDDEVELALKLMGMNQIKRIPIVDEEGALVGIITQNDILARVSNPIKIGKVLRQFAKPESAAKFL
jgi:CBS domain-containing protein